MAFNLFDAGFGEDPKSKAQKLFAEAEELFNKNTPEARAEAAPKYAEALKLWQKLGDEKIINSSVK